MREEGAAKASLKALAEDLWISQGWNADNHAKHVALGSSPDWMNLHLLSSPLQKRLKLALELKTKLCFTNTVEKGGLIFGFFAMPHISSGRGCKKNA